MKNVTITLEESLARWARIEAARAGKSLSRYIADTLARLRREGTDNVGLDEFLTGPGYPGIARDLPRRDDLYSEREDALLRRHQPSDLQPRPERSR